MRFILIALALISLLFTAPSVEAAQNDAIKALKVDMAGRQRMLTQRIAKAACYISTFNNVEKHRKMLGAARDLFADSHKALRYGDSMRGIQPEKDAAILSAMNKVEPYWKLLNFASSLLLESSENPGLDVNMIMEFNITTLVRANITVQIMEDTYTEGLVDIDPVYALINVAGRQRMLSQKSAKEFCLIGYGFKPEENRTSLRKSVETFDQTLIDMKEGNEVRGIPAAPTEEIRSQIDHVTKIWQSPRRIFLKIADGTYPKSMDFNLISDTNDTILVESNKIVQMLVKYQKDKMLKEAKDRS